MESDRGEVPVGHRCLGESRTRVAGAVEAVDAVHPIPPRGGGVDRHAARIGRVLAGAGSAPGRPIEAAVGRPVDRSLVGSEVEDGRAFPGDACVRGRARGNSGTELRPGRAAVQRPVNAVALDIGEHRRGIREERGIEHREAVSPVRLRNAVVDLRPGRTVVRAAEHAVARGRDDRDCRSSRTVEGDRADGCVIGNRAHAKARPRRAAVERPVDAAVALACAERPDFRRGAHGDVAQREATQPRAARAVRRRPAGATIDRLVNAPGLYRGKQGVHVGRRDGADAQVRKTVVELGRGNGRAVVRDLHHAGAERRGEEDRLARDRGVRKESNAADIRRGCGIERFDPLLDGACRSAGAPDCQHPRDRAHVARYHGRCIHGSSHPFVVVNRLACNQREDTCCVRPVNST